MEQEEKKWIDEKAKIKDTIRSEKKWRERMQ